MPSLLSGVTPSALFWFGTGCLVLTVLAFLTALLGGGSGGPQTAITFFVAGFVVATVAATVTAVVALAGAISFPDARIRFLVLLALSVLCHPLLWLGLITSVV